MVSVVPVFFFVLDFCWVEEFLSSCDLRKSLALGSELVRQNSFGDTALFGTGADSDSGGSGE